MKKVFIFLIFISTFHCALAQWNVEYKRDMRWVCGQSNYANFIDFTNANSSSYPTSDSMTLSMYGLANANISSDTSGKILFIYNGFYIYDSTFQLMQNGDSINPQYGGIAGGINYGPLGFQTSLILPMPEHDSLYYIFYLGSDSFISGGAKKFYYSIVNMHLNNGHGAVISKNMNLFFDSTSNLSYHLTACRHANGRDWWIINKDCSGNTYFLYLLDNNGVHALLPQSIGISFTLRYQYSTSFSPAGNKYCIYGSGSMYNIDSTSLNIFDFDRCSGLLSNAIQYNPFGDAAHNMLLYNNGIGMSFSPNGRFIYLSTRFKIMQFDILTNFIDTVALFDSSLVPAGMHNIYQAFRFAYMALARDGRIYIGCNIITPYLHVINNPDSSGTACNFSQNNLMFPTSLGWFGNFPNFRCPPLLGSECDTLGIPQPPNAVPVVYNAIPFGLNIYPNPASNIVQFGLTEPLTEGGSIIITNIIGQQIATLPLSRHSIGTATYIGNYAIGVYLCTVVNKKGERLVEGKFVKE